MSLDLDAWVQLIQVTLLFVLVSQNFGPPRRLKALESKLR